MPFRKKNTQLREETTFETTLIFSLKIEPKSKEKSRKTAHAAKIDKNAFLGAPFFAKSRFSSDFWGPAWRHFEAKSG